jgi:hypothetical protein
VRACQQQAEQFAGRFGRLGTVGVLLWFLPLFAGLFWGAPLVAREVEHGTHRLVWTQGVSRLRWALVKFGLVGGGVVLVAAGYALLVTWWRAPLDQTTGRLSGRFTYGLFDLQGLVPIGYALLAVALGVVAGAMTRRTQSGDGHHPGRVPRHPAAGGAGGSRALPAPGAPQLPAGGTTAPNQLASDWIVRGGVRSAQGGWLRGGTSGSYSQAVCPPPPSAPATAPPTTNPCLAEYGAGAYNLELIHPAERSWLFQGIETAQFAALAALLLLAAIHSVRRRIS